MLRYYQLTFGTGKILRSCREKVKKFLIRERDDYRVLRDRVCELTDRFEMKLIKFEEVDPKFGEFSQSEQREQQERYVCSLSSVLVRYRKKFVKLPFDYYEER